MSDAIIETNGLAKNYGEIRAVRNLDLAGAAVELSVIFVILSVFEKTQKLSIFYYADATKVLLKGQIPWANILGLLAFALIFLPVSIYIFKLKDI